MPVNLRGINNLNFPANDQSHLHSLIERYKNGIPSSKLLDNPLNGFQCCQIRASKLTALSRNQSGIIPVIEGDGIVSWSDLFFVLPPNPSFGLNTDEYHWHSQKALWLNQTPSEGALPIPI